MDGMPNCSACGIVLMEPFEGVGAHHGTELRQDSCASCLVDAPLIGKKGEPKEEDGDFVGIHILDASGPSL